MIKRKYLFTSSCRECGRQIEQRVPTTAESADEGVRLKCADCGTPNFCTADRTVNAPEVVG